MVDSIGQVRALRGDSRGEPLPGDDWKREKAAGIQPLFLFLIPE